jgi:hypothetical protein
MVVIPNFKIILASFKVAKINTDENNAQKWPTELYNY